LAFVAYFRMLDLLDLYDTRIGIILLLGSGASALSVWLMRNFM
jgi:ABC-type glycerol-3-phosphate transport system permease component